MTKFLAEWRDLTSCNPPLYVIDYSGRLTLYCPQQTRDRDIRSIFAQFRKCQLNLQSYWLALEYCTLIKTPETSQVSFSKHLVGFPALACFLSVSTVSEILPGGNMNRLGNLMVVLIAVAFVAFSGLNVIAIYSSNLL